MTEKKSNYSENRKNKRLFALILLLAAILLFAGIIAAYYSDVNSSENEVTTGTLKISGSYTFLLNGTETTAEEIFLNPGDIIVVSGTVTNIGNQSAWLREVVEFSADELLLPYLTVYSGVLDAQDIAEGGGTVLPLSGGVAAGTNKVIPALGETLSGGGFDYLPSNVYSFAVTIHFDYSAPNATQNKTLSISVSAQALQFINNNANAPDEEAWSAVTP